MARDLRGLHYELDFAGKLRRSFRKQTVSWLTAAAAVGALIAFAPMRKKKIYIDAKSGKKKKKGAGGNGFCAGCAENRGWVGSTGDYRIRQKSTDRFWWAHPSSRQGVSTF